MMQQGRRAGAPVSLDANFRRKLGSVSDLVAMFHALCPLADEILLGWGEASLLAANDSEDAIRSLAVSLQRPCVVVKRPTGGAICLESGRWLEHAVAPVTVVDPIGGGDGFAVGFLHERLRGSSTTAALASGTAIAARVVARRGDNEGLPYAAELEAADDGLPGAADFDGAHVGVVR
jgi:sugar/nucleoside kinase (ribokinase family)